MESSDKSAMTFLITKLSVSPRRVVVLAKEMTLGISCTGETLGSDRINISHFQNEFGVLKAHLPSNRLVIGR